MKHCFFTTNIADMLECDLKGNFDDYGFPLKRCAEYPCEKFKKLTAEIDAMRKAKISKSIKED